MLWFLTVSPSTVKGCSSACLLITWKTLAYTPSVVQMESKLQEEWSISQHHSLVSGTVWMVWGDSLCHVSEQQFLTLAFFWPMSVLSKPDHFSAKEAVVRGSLCHSGVAACRASGTSRHHTGTAVPEPCSAAARGSCCAHAVKFWCVSLFLPLKMADAEMFVWSVMLPNKSS